MPFPHPNFILPTEKREPSLTSLIFGTIVRSGTVLLRLLPAPTQFERLGRQRTIKVRFTFSQPKKMPLKTAERIHMSDRRPELITGAKSGERKPIALDPSKNPRDKILLAAIPGFNPNKACVIMVSSSLIGHDENHQVRVVPLPNEDIEGMTGSMKKIGQKSAYPVFLNPNLNATRPLLSCGGANRSKSLRGAEIHEHWVRYDPDINPSNALLYAALDNSSRPLTLQDKVVWMEKVAGGIIKRHRNADEDNDGIDDAMKYLATFLAVKPEVAKEFYTLSLLHEGVKPRLYMKRGQEGHLPKRDGLLLAQIPKDKQFEVAKNMGLAKSAHESAKILDDAIVAHGKQNAQRVAETRLTGPGSNLEANALKLLRVGEQAGDAAKENAMTGTGTGSGSNNGRSTITRATRKKATETFVGLLTASAKSLSSAASLTVDTSLIPGLSKEDRQAALTELRRLQGLVRDLDMTVLMLQSAD